VISVFFINEKIFNIFLEFILLKIIKKEGFSLNKYFGNALPISLAVLN
jgi:hypothetical protein